MTYLSVCSIYRDHAEYLREWIEFHRAVGVERFFLYDNESSDGHEQVLAPYVEEGIAVIHRWPSPPEVGRGARFGLVPAFDDCLARHRGDSRWIAFLDIDEFLFSPTGQPLPEVLTEFEPWPGVCVSRVDFGTSGHRAKPDGLVIESYLQRKRYPPGAQDLIKSIVDPRRAAKCFNAHRFLYRDGLPVDERKTTFEKTRRNKSEVSLSLLRINHYVTKSEQEHQRKVDQWTAAGQPWTHEDAASVAALEEQFDDTITRYVPAVAEALRRAPV